MAQVWLTRGGDPNKKHFDAQDRTPLHAAVIGNTSQHTALTRLLLSKEADPTIKDDTGKCVLDWIPRSRATAVILEPLKRARMNGEMLTPRGRATPRTGTEDDMTQCSLDEIETEEERERRIRNRRALVASSYNTSPRSSNTSNMTKEALGITTPRSPTSARSSYQEDITPNASPRGTPRNSEEPSLMEMKGHQIRPRDAVAHTPQGRSSARLQKSGNSSRASQLIGFKKQEPKYC